MSPYSVNIIYLDGLNRKDFIRVEANRTFIIYQIPHNCAKSLTDEVDLKQAGIYLLVQEKKHTVYVGQADARNNGNGVFGRMMEPHGRQELSDWNYGYVLTSSNPHFIGATELNYLERFFYENAAEIGRYHLLNGNRPHTANIDYSSKVALQSFIENILFLLENHTRCKVYVERNPSRSEKTSGQKVSFQSGTCVVLDSSLREAHAEGTIADDGKGITVKKGSKISIRNSLDHQSGKKRQNELRMQLVNDGIIVNYKFVKDYFFSNTSLAATIILGSSTSGPVAWKVNKRSNQ